MNPKAACILILNSCGQVLAVSRRGEFTQFGLPGGKVDGDETLVQAAIRELYEETGARVSSDDVEFLYSAGDGHGYDVTTFVLTHDLNNEGPLQHEPDTLVEWVDPRVLINGPFGSYNAQVFFAEIMRMSAGYE